MEFVVNNIKLTQTVVNPADSSASAKAQGEFIIIDMTVRNISNDVQTYFTGSRQRRRLIGQQFSVAIAKRPVI